MKGHLCNVFCAIPGWQLFLSNQHLPLWVAHLWAEFPSHHLRKDLLERLKGYWIFNLLQSPAVYSGRPTVFLPWSRDKAWRAMSLKLNRKLNNEVICYYSAAAISPKLWWCCATQTEIRDVHGQAQVSQSAYQNHSLSSSGAPCFYPGRSASCTPWQVSHMDEPVGLWAFWKTSGQMIANPCKSIQIRFNEANGKTSAAKSITNMERWQSCSNFFAGLQGLHQNDLARSHNLHFWILLDFWRADLKDWLNITHSLSRTEQSVSDFAIHSAP